MDWWCCVFDVVAGDMGGVSVGVGCGIIGTVKGSVGCCVLVLRLWVGCDGVGSAVMLCRI